MEELKRVADYWLKQIKEKQTMREAAGLLRVLVEAERRRNAEETTPLQEKITNKC